MRTRSAYGLVVVVVIQGCSPHPAAVESVSFARVPTGWQSWSAITVIAHRGYACCYPENTLEAIESSIASGARAVEVDVHMTRDDVPILMHDPTLDRTTDSWGLLRNRSLGELTTINACPGHEVPCAVPTLRSALELSKGRAMMVLDLKDATKRDIVERILAEIEEAGMEEQVAIISPLIESLIWARAVSKSVPIGLYVSPSDGPTVYETDMPTIIDYLLVLGGAELMLRTDEVENKGQLYQAALLNGIPVAVWTAHNRTQLRELLAIPGVTRALSDVAP